LAIDNDSEQTSHEEQRADDPCGSEPDQNVEDAAH